MSGRNATADRAIDVLLLFDRDPASLSASEVATQLGMSRSTTYRYLQSLRACDLLEEVDGGARFRLGPRILQLARVARTGYGLREVALPVMRKLAVETDEDVLLTRRSGTQVVCVERVQSSHRVRLSYEPGHVLPIHAGASAKVLLAFTGEDEIGRTLKEAKPLTRFTDQTITSLRALRAELLKIREEGYAVSEGEVDPGVCGVATPVRWPDGRIAAGVTVAGMAYRLTPQRVPSVIAAAREAAAEISVRLTELD